MLYVLSVAAIVASVDSLAALFCFVFSYRTSANLYLIASLGTFVIYNLNHLWDVREDAINAPERVVVARPEADHGKRPTFTARPSAWAWASVRPHQASSGSV